MTLPAFVATLVATWYGGILGVGEYSWRYGVSNWLVFGVPYYIGALLFAWLFARRAREAALYTIPDLLDRHYGRGPALVGALAVFVTSAPAAYVLMLGTLFAAMFGLPLVPCVVARRAALAVLHHTAAACARWCSPTRCSSCSCTSASSCMLGFLVAQHGGLGVPRRARCRPRTSPGTAATPPQAILVWYFIALSALVDPGFWQRAYAARDPRGGAARRAVVDGVLDRVRLPDHRPPASTRARCCPHLADPVFAFPELARADAAAGGARALLPRR